MLSPAKRELLEWLDEQTGWVSATFMRGNFKPGTTASSVRGTRGKLVRAGFVKSERLDDPMSPWGHFWRYRITAAGSAALAVK